MSYITKKRIANTCKDLIVQTSVEQVSITKIMKTMNMRRQTFYDFFLDKYDLIEWLYNDEITEIVEDNLDYEKWHNIVNYLCTYFFDNRVFFRKIFNDTNQNNNISENSIKNHFQNLISVIMADISKVENVPFTNEHIEFTKEIFATSLLGELKSWINNHHRRDIELEAKFINLYLEDTINGMLLRQKNNNHDYHYFD